MVVHPVNKHRHQCLDVVSDHVDRPTESGQHLVEPCGVCVLGRSERRWAKSTKAGESECNRFPTQGLGERTPDVARLGQAVHEYRRYRGSLPAPIPRQNTCCAERGDRPFDKMYTFVYIFHMIPHTRTILATFTVVTLLAAACTADADETTTIAAAVSGAGVVFDRAGYFDTPWPSTHTDGWRTQATQGGLPDGVASADLVATSVEVPPFPVLGYTRGDHVYVLGGSPSSMELYTNLILRGESSEASPDLLELAAEHFIGKQATPYVAKIDPSTMTAEILELTEGSTLNYIGAMVMHENGWIYAVSQSVLYKIDADAFSIEDTLELPLMMKDGEVDENTTYNSMMIKADGQLVLKGADILEQAEGKTTQGILLLVDPDELAITARTDSDSVGTPRLTIAVEDGRELLYHSTGNVSNRFVIIDDGFELDDSWTATYRPADQSGTQGASSPVYMGGSDAVVFSNNTLPFGVTTPMLLYGQPTTADVGSVLGQQAFDNPNPQINWYLVAADPFVSNMVVVEDQLNGLVAGWRLGEDASLTKVWESDAYRVSAGNAIAYPQGHVYVDDRRCDEDGENCTAWLIVLDIETGDLLAEVQVAGSLPSNSQIFVGSDAVYYIATEADSPHGYITRVAAGG